MTMYHPAEFIASGPCIVCNEKVSNSTLEDLLSHEIYHYYQIVGSSLGLLIYELGEIKKGTIKDYIAFLFDKGYCSENSRLSEISPKKIEKIINKHDRKHLREYKKSFKTLEELSVLFTQQEPPSVVDYLVSLSLFYQCLGIESKEIKKWIKFLDHFNYEGFDARLFLDNDFVDFKENLRVELEDDGQYLKINTKMVIENYASIDKSVEIFFAELSGDKNNEIYQSYPKEHIVLNYILLIAFSALVPNADDVIFTLKTIYEISLMTELHPVLIDSEMNIHQRSINIDRLSVPKRFLKLFNYFKDVGRIKVSDCDINDNDSIIDLYDRICEELDFTKYSVCLRRVAGYSMWKREPFYSSQHSGTPFGHIRHIHERAAFAKTKGLLTAKNLYQVIYVLENCLVPLVYLNYDGKFSALNPGSLKREDIKKSHLFLYNSIYKTCCENTIWELFFIELISSNNIQRLKKILNDDNPTIEKLLNLTTELRTEAKESAIHSPKSFADEYN